MNLRDLRQTANLHIQDVFHALGLQPSSDNYGQIRMACPIHDGDNKSAFAWDKQYGTFRCYTHDCHEKAKRPDVFGFVCLVLNCKMPRAIQFLGQLFGLDVDHISSGKDNDGAVQNRKFIRSALRPRQADTIYNQDVLSKLKQPYFYIVDQRGFSRQICDRYQIGYCDDTGKMFNGRVVIPIRDIKNRIVGFTARKVSDFIVGPKWFHKLDRKWLFNLNFAMPHIQDTRQALLVQGPFDVFALEEASIHNSVAVLGKELSDFQVDLLISSGVDTIKIVFDADGPGLSGARKIQRNLRKLFDVEVVQMTSYGDLGDAPAEYIKDLLK